MRSINDASVKSTVIPTDRNLTENIIQMYKNLQIFKILKTPEQCEPLYKSCIACIFMLEFNSCDIAIFKIFARQPWWHALPPSSLYATSSAHAAREPTHILECGPRSKKVAHPCPRGRWTNVVWCPTVTSVVATKARAP